MKIYKNILFVSPNLDKGGSQKFFLNLVRFLKKNLVNPKLIIFNFNERNSYDCKDLTFDNFNRRSILSTYKLYEFIKKNSIKTIFSNQFQANIIVIFMKIIFKEKIRIIIRETNSPKEVIKHEKNFINKFIHYYFRKFYDYADFIICPSNDLKKELLENYTFGKNKIKVIYNSVNKKDILKNSNKHLSKKYHKFFKKNVFIFHGRLEYQKGLDILIQAFEIFKNKNFILLILGTGSKMQELKNLSKLLGLNNQIFFLGFQNNPYNFIKFSDYYVFPSRFEGMPNSLLDAVALSKLIVSSDCNHGAKEIMKDYDNGILFQTNSVLSLKRSLLQITKMQKKIIPKNYFKNFDEKNNFNKIQEIINNQ